jgi:hypothetical protein
MLVACLVRLLRFPFPLERVALPKKGGEIARDECKEKEHQTFDSHVVINLLGTQKCFFKKWGGAAARAAQRPLAAQYSGGD